MALATEEETACNHAQCEEGGSADCAAHNRGRLDWVVCGMSGGCLSLK